MYAITIHYKVLIWLDTNLPRKYNLQFLPSQHTSDLDLRSRSLTGYASIDWLIVLSPANHNDYFRTDMQA